MVRALWYWVLIHEIMACARRAPLSQQIRWFNNTFSPRTFPEGNALRFSHHANEIRKPKTRNASHFRRLTIVKYNSFTTDLNNNIHDRCLLKFT
ncbi:uncharacterized protein BKA55DRAFT_142030 [Fusarium redolens]|uniref:Secreted protein n=1 Tax=Fusarium redolens TaxID=48865 RepID=A0A9P9G7D9_FUSRE|nr:uncharacterized protein BKA55DRAFT_142030 [Fusarium redolens]KAH7233766.1 hypothetical protein BKA55DRAFT_142030 [Fusarium redolens]